MGLFDGQIVLVYMWYFQVWCVDGVDFVVDLVKVGCFVIFMVQIGQYLYVYVDFYEGYIVCQDGIFQCFDYVWYGVQCCFVGWECFVVWQDDLVCVVYDCWV